MTGVTSSPTFVVVAATDHPDVDDWVLEQARAEAARSGVRLVAYLGREDTLPEPRPPDLCCHVFTAEPDQPGGLP